MKRKRSAAPPQSSRQGKREDGPGRVRIVGGELRGRTLVYSGDIRLRPMKDRTREAVFNLVGPDVRTMFAWDLFAGTGALGIEAVSRGAVGALLIEQHIPSYKIIRDNVQALNLEGKVRYVQSDVFHWVASHHDPAATVGIPPETPWLVFCSPPYAFFHEREEAMQKMLVTLRDRAPAGSALVVESEAPFDFETFWPDDWDVRSYPPALVGLWHKPTESETAEI